MTLLPRLFAGLAALALAVPLFAFEGKVHFETGTAKKPQPLVYSIKGEKARMEFGAGAHAVIDGTKQEMYMLMPEQKMYMVVSFADVADVAQNQMDDVQFEATGDTETILGRKCEKYRATEKNGTTTEIWATEGMGKFIGQLGGSGGLGGRNKLPQWQQDLAKKGFFPLRIVTINRRGKETSRMEATKIEDVSLASSLFEIPPGYQRFDMGGIMRGLIPGSK
ncbi:MAG TPA: DUF4412 domain-containing protein [Candidatus Synoicihabitans sp.]|nr:DUF4412 domain-containing protein [Candidatus Synoicihabitans sp.]